MTVQIIGTEHHGGGKTMKVLRSLNFNYDIYCLEIDMHRLSTMTWFDEDVHMECNIVCKSNDTSDWASSSIPIGHKSHLVTQKKFSSNIQDSLLSECKLPEGNGYMGEDIKFVLENVSENDRVALVDSGLLTSLKRINNLSSVNKFLERMKVNRFFMNLLRIANPYSNFNKCHRLTKYVKRYILPHANLMYDHREKEIVSNIEENANNNDDILLVIGYNHLIGVSKRLRSRGYDVESVDAIVNEELA